MLSVLKTAKTVREASDIVLTKFERPANQSEAVKEKRAAYGQKYYDQFADTGTGQVVSYPFVDEWATAIPESTVEPTGTENLHPMSGVQTIHVKWARTGDGKVLETSFDITVTDVD